LETNLAQIELPALFFHPAQALLLEIVADKEILPKQKPSSHASRV
jgi:hypothetical protein